MIGIEVADLADGHMQLVNCDIDEPKLGQNVIAPWPRCSPCRSQARHILAPAPAFAF
jgi:hypothetical protein